ncbi:MAG TPA: radical SAM family heme chaperone HemW, partial [Terriglobales bacterium]|nr:radical SAM family heme chaperone HemW [Terriglobales bacterium]
EEMRQAQATAAALGGHFEAAVDSVYLGGGTPTVLPAEDLQRLFACLGEQFAVARDAEITVECAPGSLDECMLATLAACGVNRISLGVQSMVDGEAAAVGRQHKRATVLNDIANLRAAGIHNVNLDLIAGLPHQTRESWEYSLGEAVASGVPHVSVYMLEVDEDSRLGRELIAGGTKYHAHFVPDDDLTADFYETACARLNAAGIMQYEISNFAREGFESRHNQKYWTRQPYLGFGVDAHSMLPASEKHRANGVEGIRLATTDHYDQFLIAPEINATEVSPEQALEESFFLGLRLNRGVSLSELRARFGPAVERFISVIDELVAGSLLQRSDDNIRLTGHGRLLSNEVFQKFIHVSSAVV